MIIIIGKFLSIINKVSPKIAYYWRGRVLATIMAENTFGFMQKLSVLNKAERFFSTMSREDRSRLIGDLGLPVWANGGMFKGMMEEKNETSTIL